MRAVIVLVFLSLPGRAEPVRSWGTETVEGLTNFVASCYASVYLHEQAHAWAVRSSGGKVTKISVSMLSGRTQFHGDFSDDQMQAINLAGYTTNRLSALGAGMYLDHARTNTFVTRFASTFYFVNRLVIVAGWLEGLVGQTDFRDSVDGFTTHKSERDWLYGAYGALIALDIYLSWDSIVRNYGWMRGRPPLRASTSDFNLQLLPIAGGAAARLSHTF